ncbi:MAG: hypothetical protein RL141_435 [Candidatus Parcubacteria bacterium]|jgi:diadenosine tetraphosphate (Ap4A) HIT family hydrolase
MGVQKKVVDPRFAKGKEYRAVINKIAGEAKCPFCPDNFRYHKNPILKRHGSWFLTRSSWPYPHTQEHFLIMGTKHKELLAELSGADWKSLAALAAYAVKTFKLPGGAIAMRFGETAYTGATVCHLHAHLIVPKKRANKKMADTVMFPIG